MDESFPVFKSHNKLPNVFEVGKGNVLALSGNLHHRYDSHFDVEVGVGNITYKVHEKYEPGTLLPSNNLESDHLINGVWCPVPFNKRSTASQVSVSLTIGNAANRENLLVVDEINLHDTKMIKLGAGVLKNRGYLKRNQPLIAICLATYNPDLTAFRRQIDSIVAQTYKNWVCIVNDDCSPTEIAKEIEAFCEDSRIYFRRNEANLGFYLNFDKCLRYVPENAEYIALADQDDYWYPEKLSRLVEAFDESVELVYSDMRIVDASDNVVSETYWQQRKNEYQDASIVLLANTVTGAASLFRRRLLPDILPFPDRIGDAFHDHWIACVALTRGGIGYIDEPLYDYYQYGTSVIGHCDFTPVPLWKRIYSLLKNLFRLLIPTQSTNWLKKIRAGSLAVYYGECRRLEIITQVLKLRMPEKSDQAHLFIFGRGFFSAVKLLLLHGRIVMQRKTTDDAEFRLAMGYIFKWLEDRRLQLKQKRLGRRNRTAKTA